MGNVDFSKLMKSKDVLVSFGPSIRAAARIEGAFTGTRGKGLISALYAIEMIFTCAKGARGGVTSISTPQNGLHPKANDADACGVGKVGEYQRGLLRF